MTRQLQAIVNILSLISFLGVCVLLTFQFGKEKIVYIDSLRLMKGYKGMEAAQKEFQKKMMDWNAHIDTLKKELEVKISDYGRIEKGLSNHEKDQLKGAIAVKENQLNAYQEEVTKKMQTENSEISGKVLSRVNDLVKRYGEKRGYTIILATTQNGNIVYADGGTDITEDVLKELNAEY